MARKTNRKSNKKSGGKHPGDSPSERPLPKKSEILDFIKSSRGKTGKRELGRAFGIRGAQRVAFKRLLREMADEGLIEGRRRKITRPGELPPVAVLIITHIDDEGDLVARPDKWQGQDAAPQILVVSETAGRNSASFGVGDRVLARIDRSRQDDDDALPPYRARVIKKLPGEHRELLGIFRRLEDGSGMIDPVDRKMLREWLVEASDCRSLEDGELVRFRPARGGRRYGPSLATISARLGNIGAKNNVSLIAINRHDIPDRFSAEILDELDHLPALSMEDREDIRELALITIDPADARDHDDAVHARRDDDSDNPGGHVVTVAIADVAQYARPGSQLDREALKRGNSVYFPDRVVPMLPEKISNDLCSLRENEDRPCLAVEMRFDAQGRKIDHRFKRAMMRSCARLSYEQAQRAIDGRGDERTIPLLDSVLKPLWDAWRTLQKARALRNPLELELPERKIIMDDNGRISDILTPERLDAHRVIEELMICANICAAETLHRAGAPVIYRVHPAPSIDKLKTLADFLQTLKIKIPRSATIRARQLNDILARVKGSEMEELVNETILRSQSQAEYNIRNEGHFGLNLRQYAHFTSPIRRYADLVVHRSLIRTLGFGAGGLDDRQAGQLETIASDLSDLERRAMTAERETTDRLIAYHMADNIGGRFGGRISGVTRSGLFVRLDDTGADGFIPASTIGREYFFHDEKHQALVGEHSGEIHRLGAAVTVRLVEAVPSAGALRFELISRGEFSKKADRTANGRRKERKSAARKKSMKSGKRRKSSRR